MFEPCVSCARLAKCKKVFPVMLEDGGGCSLHEESHEGVTRARIRAVFDFGAFAVCTKNPKRETLPMPVGQKRYLRGIAIHLGLIPPRGGNSFKIPAADLAEMISKFTTDEGAAPYESIGDLDVEELKTLLADLKENGAPAGSGGEEKAEEKAEEEAPPKKAPAKKPRRPRKKPAPKEEVEEEVEEEASEEEEEEVEKKAPAKKAPVKKAPARRAPAKAKKTAAAPAAAAAASADLEKLEGMVTTIGTMLDKHVDAQASRLEGVETVLTRVLEHLETLDGYLAYQYNQDVDSGNEITSLSDVDWRS